MSLTVSTTAPSRISTPARAAQAPVTNLENDSPHDTFELGDTAKAVLTGAAVVGIPALVTAVSPALAVVAVGAAGVGLGLAAAGVGGSPEGQLIAPVLFIGGAVAGATAAGIGAAVAAFAGIPGAAVMAGVGAGLGYYASKA